MIIGLGHKIKSGKDTVAKIIQLLILGVHKDDILNNLQNTLPIPNDGYPEYEIKRFADKIKEIVSLLIGCTLEQLENHDFKNTELGEEWVKYIVWGANGHFYKEYSNYEEALKRYNEFSKENAEFSEVKLTPRLLFNLLGTECGRKIIHPNIWINALFSSYISEDRGKISGKDYPESNWIITDVRFPNEADAIKRKKGILIKVNRPFCFDSLEDYLVCYPEESISKKTIQFVEEFYGSYPEMVEHFKIMFPEECKQFFSNSHKLESENALNDYQEWDYVIENTGTLENLLHKVEEILKKENII